MKPFIPMTVFQERRQHLLTAIGDAILILPSAKEMVRNRDCYFPFRQDSDFLYLSGFNEPDAVMILDGKTKQSILFSKKYDETHAIWEGTIIGQKRAQEEFLFDNAHEISTFKASLQTYLFTHHTIITPFSRYPDMDTIILEAVKNIKETRQANAPQTILNSDGFIHPMRLIKDTHEIAMMKYAADIAVSAHKAAMQETKPNTNEAEIVALFDYHFSKNGGTASYNHIVAGGNNACTLHYTDNNDTLKNNDILLIDAGYEHEGYASDITRSFPVNGRFSDTQKHVYQWVLKSMKAALAAAKPGAHIRTPHFAAQAVLIEAMIDLGLLSGNLESIEKDKSYQRYFMHGTSHWLGIDVHDVGDYKDENGDWLTLKPGMALTIEPGIYIREDDTSAPKELRGIGIRIEDDIIITETGHLNLTQDAPKEIADIESYCNTTI